MHIKVDKPKHSWHYEFKGLIFEVIENDPNHHQIGVMTKYGRTWFDRDAATELPQPASKSG